MMRTFNSSQTASPSAALRMWMRRGGVMLLVGMLLGALSGCGHDPNHDIDPVQARKAADRVHAPPKPGEKLLPGHGG